MTPEERAQEALTLKMIAICNLATAAANLYASSMGGTVMPSINRWNALRDAIEIVNAAPSTASV